MNKVKVIATIGPASRDKETIREMVQNGVDVIRLNLTHADYTFCTEIIDKVKELRTEMKQNISIMLDTKGPDVQIGKLAENQVFLTKGDKIRVYMDDILGDQTKFSVTYPNLLQDVKYNTILKLSDGRLELEVIDKGIDYLLCLVKNDGTIYSGTKISIPGIQLNRPFLTEQDCNDIIFASNMEIDFLAVSLVTNSEDILEVNDRLIELENDHIGIFAKIEREEAVEDLDNIIKACEGVIVSRNDLGLSIPMERIPGIQKTLINKCHMAGKISIVAAEFLSSMEEEAHPTRAEVSDIANAVLDGADAVMLCGETTIGKFPTDTVKVMEKVIFSAEEDINYYELLDRAIRTEKQDITGSLACSVIECANRLKCKAIFAPTVSGYTARKMSRFRPTCPIIAISPDPLTVRSLALHFGVHPILIDELKQFDAIIEQAKKMTKDLFDLEPNDKIIITGGYPFQEVKHTNFMKIEEL